MDSRTEAGTDPTRPEPAAGPPISAAVRRCQQDLTLDPRRRIDHIDTITAALPDGDDHDARWWAERVFSPRAMPLWVRTLMGARMLVVPALAGLGLLRDGRASVDRDAFAVTDEVDGEALIVSHQPHLSFYCGIRSDSGFLLVTTVVSLRGLPGRAYWSVVQFFHGPVLAAMMRRALAGRGRPVAD